MNLIFAAVKIKRLPLVLLLTLSGSLVCAQDSLVATYLQDVVVTGQFEPQSARKSVYQIKTIPLELIAAKGAVRLQDVLNTELNIRFTQDLALGGSNLSMQGLAGQNVKVLIDGVPMVGRQGTSNEININQINVNSIDRIEIIEGPMSVVYGADALAGVINIITKKSVEGKLDLSVKVHEETVGSEYSGDEGIHNETIGGGYSKNRFRVRADLSRNYFGGWQGNGEGRDKQWHPKTQYLASALTGYDWDKTKLYYRIDYLNENIYNPGIFQGGEAVDQDYITNRFMHQVQGSHTFTDKLQFNGAFSYTDFQRETQTTTVNEATGDRRLAIGAGLQDLTKFDGLTFRGTVQYKLSTKLTLQPGVDLNYESGSGGRIKEGTQSIGDYAFFISGEWKINKFLQVRPGVRVVYNTIYQAPPFIPSINTKFILSDRHDLRLSYGRGFRAPSLRELYFDFFDASHAIEGNENLEAELSHSINGSWNWQIFDEGKHKLSTAIGGFYNSIDNLIGYGQKPSNTLITTYINIDKYKTKGITWNNTWKTSGLELSAGVAYTGRFNQLNESYNDVDEFVWSPEVTSSATYRMQKAGLVFSMYYKLTGKTPYYEVVSDNGTQIARLAQISSYQWTDFSIQKELGKRFSVTGGVRNLFDITNVNNTALTAGTHTTGGARPVGYGRSYFLNFSYTLNK
jgi:outer membrane receptor for ferrienterochelin and colicins